MLIPGFNQEQVEFLRKLGHELRTPLNSVITTTEMLLGNFYGELNPKQQTSAERVLRNGDRLLHMIEGAMLYIRALSNALEVSHEPLNPHGVVEALIEQHRQRAAAGGVTLDYGNALPAAYILTSDTEKFSVIAQKLIENAIDYAPNGRATITLEKQEAHWQLRVADTGLGIRAEDLPNLFTPFWRGMEAKRLHPQGNGLGLALSRELARLLGGEIAVQSIPGEGATFTVKFPL